MEENDKAQKEKNEQQQFVEKQVRYHPVTPSHKSAMGALYLCFGVRNYPHAKATRPKLNADQEKLARRLVAEGKGVPEIAHTFNVHPSTIYRLSALEA